MPTESLAPDEASSSEPPSDSPHARFAPATVVARAAQGDLASFEELVDRYSAPILRLAVRIVGHRAEAEDVVQECFILVWRRLPTLQDPQAFHAWLYHLATRQCLNALRARSRRPVTPLEPEVLAETAPSASDAGPEEQAGAGAQMRALSETVRGLPEDLRMCWVLKELHDLSYDEVGYALGIPASTVRGRLSRARRMLAEGMASWR